MMPITTRIRPNSEIGWKGTEPWRDGYMRPSVDPKFCHCGGKALYQMNGDGFCKAHQSDAVAAAKRTRTRGEL
jgi:hypothetical protein